MKFNLTITNLSTVSINELTLSVSYYLKKNEELIPHKQDFTFFFDSVKKRTQSLDLGDEVSLDDGLSIVLKKGNGNVIKQFNYLAKDLSGTMLNIEFSAEETPATAASTPSRPLMVYGRLLDILGKQKMEDVQVIVRAKKRRRCSTGSNRKF